MRKAAVLIYILLFGVLRLYANRVQPDSFWVYVDKGGQLTINDIKDRTDFTQVSNLNFGYTEATIWVRLPIERYFKDEGYCVVARHPTVWEVDFYMVVAGRVTDRKFVGISRPKQNRELFLAPYFLDVSPGQPNQEVYVRMKEVGASLHNNIFFQQKWQMQREAMTSAILYYGSVGAILVLFMYVMFKFFTLRKRLFLYYGVWLLSIILFLSVSLEYAYHFLPDAWIDVTHQLRFFLLIPAIIFWVLFAYHVLAINETGDTFIKKAFYVLPRVYPLFLLPVFFSSRVIAYIKYPTIASFYILSIATFWLVMYAAWVSARNGHRPARYFLVGQGVFVLAYSLVQFRNFGVLPNSELSLFVPLLCQLFEMAVMFVCMERHFHFQKAIERAVTTKLPQQTVLETLVHDTIEETGAARIGQDVLNLFNKVKAYFECEKVYLNAELKISDIAEKLGVPSYQISKCINLCSNMHFFDFVNSYRIEAAKQLIKSEEMSQKYTLEHIANQSGFNSKSTFNAAFKKFTGMTPTQFKNANLSPLPPASPLSEGEGRTI